MDLEKNYFNQSIPIPNYVIDSGRGMYLIWIINAVPSKALPLWKAVQEYLYNQLKYFGADRQALDATRILRVPGSINSKPKTVVNILDEYEYVYDLREIQNGFLPELKPYEKKKGRPSKINYIYRERSLYYGRIQDIIKLCELREYDLKGHRELILFLYRYYLCSFTEDIEKAKKIYQEKLKSQGKLNEKEKISQRREKIKDLLDEGLKQKDICLLLNISKPTYVHDRNFLKEQGYIKPCSFKNFLSRIYVNLDIFNCKHISFCLSPLSKRTFIFFFDYIFFVFHLTYLELLIALDTFFLVNSISSLIFLFRNYYCHIFLFFFCNF